MTIPPGRRLRVAVLGLLLGLAATQVACITRTTRTKAWSEGDTQVILRGKMRGSEPVSQGFQHPVTISPVRMAHILSRIDIRKGNDGDREAAIPLESLYLIGEAITEGLQLADSSQEVVVQSIRHRKKWGVFDHQHLTSLVCYMKDELLYIHIARSDWEIPPRMELRDRLPEAYPGEHRLEFRLVIDPGMAMVDKQGVAVNWRDPVFGKPTRTRVTASGKVVRRQVLMENLADDPELGALTTNLTPEQLRALADLEEERRDGALTEAQYNSRRARIMSGNADGP